MVDCPDKEEKEGAIGGFPINPDCRNTCVRKDHGVIKAREQKMAWVILPGTFKLS